MNNNGNNGNNDNSEYAELSRRVIERLNLGQPGDTVPGLGRPFNGAFSPRLGLVDSAIMVLLLVSTGFAITDGGYGWVNNLAVAVLFLMASIAARRVEWCHAEISDWVFIAGQGRDALMSCMKFVKALRSCMRDTTAYLNRVANDKNHPDHAEAQALLDGLERVFGSEPHDNNRTEG